MDYFELYGIPETFSIDETDIKRKFYALSKQFHPDFHANESPEKQQEILELSTVNNKAYQVLADPIKRVEYILERHKLISEGEKYQLPQGFLMDMMEINENLMELEFDFDYTTFNAIVAQLNLIEYALKEELTRLSKAFDDKSDTDQNSILLSIKDLWYRQKYLLRIRDSLDKFASR